MSLFEIVDTTDDEIYFTMAVYDDFETAKEELLKKAQEDLVLTDHGDDYEEIEIRSHYIGWRKGYKTRMRLNRHRVCCEETGEDMWVNNDEEFD